jgi:hypothetical protein
MTYHRVTVAIQPDDYTAPGKPAGSDASSPRWTTLLEQAGHSVRPVNVYRPDILDQVRGCDGFMWRWAHFGGMYQIARRLIPVLEGQLRLAVYPDQNTCWHYDDKAAQAFLLPGAGIPVPRTWVWFDYPSAREWISTASYPLVLKLAEGAASTNVVLVRSPQEAEVWLNRLFRSGLGTLQWKPWSWRKRLRAAAKCMLIGHPPAHPWPLHRNYALFQEFLSGNDHDTRVTVIGDRAFAFRRFNRVNDFRASGSGLLDYDAAAVAPDFVRLAFLVARRLKTQSCAIDGLWKERQAVVGEISYTYVSSAVHECPGHWELQGEPETGTLQWVPGQMWPEEAQIADFLQRLERRAHNEDNA